MSEEPTNEPEPVLTTTGRVVDCKFQNSPNGPTYEQSVESSIMF